MLKEPTQTLDGPALSEEVYQLALERIKALLGCTEDSPEERELIDWATIADAYEHSVHNNDNVTAAPALAPAAQQSAQEKDGGEWVMHARNCADDDSRTPGCSLLSPHSGCPGA